MARDVDGLVAGMRLLEPGFRVVARPIRRVARVRYPATDVIDTAVDAVLAAVGFDVVDVDPSGWLGAWRPAMTVLDYEAARSFEPLMDRLDEIGDTVAERIVRSATTTEAEYRSALAQRDEWRAELAAMFEEFDVIAVPTLTEPVPPVTDPAGRLVGTTVQVNHGGVPAVALPVGRPDPIPPGLQLVGPWGSEEWLLGVAATDERAAG
jgi:amidase